MPAWTKTQLEQEFFEACSSKALEELTANMQYMTTVCTDFRTASPEKRASARAELQRLQNLAALRDRCSALDLHLADVPGDGSCGIWSLMSLLMVNPMLSADDSSHLATRDSTREELREMWLSVANEPLWQMMFSVLREEAQPLAEPVPSLQMKLQMKYELKYEKLKQELKQEQVKKEKINLSVKRMAAEGVIDVDMETPPKKQRLRPSLEPDLIDLGTPPSAPVKVTQCRPALNLIRPADSEPVKLKQPGPVQASQKLEEGRTLVKHETSTPQAEPPQRAKEDLNSEDSEGSACFLDEFAEGKLKRKHRHQRTCHVKILTVREIQMKAIKGYLSENGGVWPLFQKMHHQSNYPAKSIFCPGGGYVNLQIRLTKGQKPECESCLAFISHIQFDQDDFERYLEEVQQQEAKNAASSSRPRRKKRRRRGSKQQGSEDEDAKDAEDPFQYVRSLKPVISLLPRGFQGKKFPYRCNICRSRLQPNGRVGDLVKADVDTVRFFMDKHLNSQGHRAAVNKDLFEDSAANRIAKPRPCQGLPIGDSALSSLSNLVDEYKFWLSLADLESFARHSYWSDHSKDEHFVRHVNCSMESMAESRPPICADCLSLGNAKNGLLRCVVRSAVKHWAAKLLSAKLFHTKLEQAALEEEMHDSHLFRRFSSKLEVLLKLSIPELQQEVRQGFMAVPIDRRTAAMRDLIEGVVKPCLAVNASSLGKNEEFAQVLSKFSQLVMSGQLSELQELNVRIATGVISGTMDSHPMIQGVALSCLRQCDKSIRGIEDRRGRIGNLSETERQALADVGCQFALAGGNSKIATVLGMSATAQKIKLDDLESRGLPCPALALTCSDYLKKNLQLIDQKLFRCLLV